MTGSDITNADFISEWQNIVEIMARIVNVPSAIITRVDEPFIEVFRTSTNDDNPYHEGAKVDLARHYCETVIRSGEMLHVADARKSPEWNAAPEIEYGMVSYLGYPVCWPDGEVFGTLCVLDSRENQFDDMYRELLQRFRNLVETHLEMFRKNREIERQRDELQSRLEEIRQLKGIIPICAKCKNVRNDQGYWEQVETYMKNHSDAEFTHSLCPSCIDKYYGEFSG